MSLYSSKTLWLTAALTLAGCGGGSSSSEKQVSSGDDSPPINATPEVPQTPEQEPRNTYEPEDGKVLFFIGQDNEGVGGNQNIEAPQEKWSGYLNTEAPKAAGITSYISLVDSSSNPSANVPQGKMIAGLFNKTNYGAGPVCLQCYLDSPDIDWSDTLVHLSIWYADGSAGDIAQGERDHIIAELAEFLAIYPNIKFFIRPGYEFEFQYQQQGVSSQDYIGAFQRIVSGLREAGVGNFVSVYSGASAFTSIDNWQQYYPGDDYVDWLGYSFFEANTNPTTQAGGLAFAQQAQKPVMIAEACLHDVAINQANGEDVWNEYFVSLLQHIGDHPETIKALAYINTDWRAHSLWQTNPYWDGTDSRIQNSDYILQQFQSSFSTAQFLTADDDVYDALN
ncbi:glycosyl hydrolase [Echinimonas agarilytica]|uniref:GH26 domain-containing protein n=1 Tax=Echinimonas agarilytica TaxID=1215918 RepID=A0AA41W5W6_9GAMM|nr:glycosyl hydrolase [Echinimonas agarilytica]MCM2679654.1 hypothetical protein [Echinimonas agarilytica]